MIHDPAVTRSTLLVNTFTTGHFCQKWKTLRRNSVRLLKIQSLPIGNFITGQNEREETTQDTIVTKNAACASYKTLRRNLLLVKMKEKKLLKIQSNLIVTQNAACASYKSNYVTYITATYTRAKRRWHAAPLRMPRREMRARAGLSLGPYRVPVQCAARRPYLRP